MIKLFCIFVLFINHSMQSTYITKNNPRFDAMPSVIGCVDEPSERGLFTMEHWKNLSLEPITEFIEGIGWVTEEWRDVKGWEDIYQISSFGRVKSLARVISLKSKLGNDMLRRLPEIIMSPRDSVGYLKVNLYSKQKTRWAYIHALICEAFIDNPLGRKIVNHKDGNKRNNGLSNLEWCTAKENINHARTNGLMRQFSKLNEYEAIRIKEQYNNMSFNDKKALAKELGVAVSTIYKIGKGERWAHLNNKT